MKIMKQEVKIISATGISSKGDLSPENIFRQAMIYAGQNAAICYSKNDFPKVETIEDEEKCIARAIKYGAIHQSIHDHFYITFQIKLPKYIAMILNSINVYNTSEKSSRHMEMEPETELEMELYKKWLDKFPVILSNTINKEEYSLTEKEIDKVAKENSRYLISVFTPTMMSYTISFRMAILLALYLKKIIGDNSHNPKYPNNTFDYVAELSDLILKVIGVNEENIPLIDIKNESIRFLDAINDKEEVIGDSYTLRYKGSLAMIAQAQRHRSIRYSIGRLEPYEYYIPPILTNETLKKEWISDIKKISDIIVPQALLVDITEQGIFEDFALKCKERLCSRAQLEIRNSTKENLLKFNSKSYNLSSSNKKLLDYMIDSNNNNVLPRCRFRRDFVCHELCNKKEKLSEII